MTAIRIFIDDKGIKKKLERLTRKFKPSIIDGVYKTAKVAQIFAKTRVPKHTGETQRAILGIVKYSGNNFIRAEVGFKKFNIPHYSRTKPFSLPYWMTFSESALDFPWRGGKNPRFMFETKDYIRERFGKELQLKIKDLIYKKI